MLLRNTHNTHTYKHLCIQTCVCMCLCVFVKRCKGEGKRKKKRPAYKWPSGLAACRRKVYYSGKVPTGARLHTRTERERERESESERDRDREIETDTHIHSGRQGILGQRKSTTHKTLWDDFFLKNEIIPRYSLSSLSLSLTLSLSLSLSTVAVNVNTAVVLSRALQHIRAHLWP
jgi:hypothetical protein